MNKHVNTSHGLESAEQILGVTSASSPPKPNYLPPDLDGIPEELKPLPQWVVWRAEPPRHGKPKWRKVPYIAQTAKPAPASTTNAATWRRFDEAVVAFQASQALGRPYDGVGFVFNGEVSEDGFCYCGLDWDAWTDAAQAQLNKLATYAELSVSGNGVHAIARAASFPAVVCKTPELEAEAYCDKRYFAFTGRRIEGAALTIEARPDEVAEVVAEVHAASGRLKQSAPAPRASDIEWEQPPAGVITGSGNAADNIELTAGVDLLDIDKFKSAVWGLTDEWLASEANWMKLARICANEAMRNGEHVWTEALWDVLDRRSRGVKGYDRDDNRERFERCLREYEKRDARVLPILAGSLYHHASEQGWSWSPSGGSGAAFAPVRPLSPSEASAAAVSRLVSAAGPIDLNAPIPHRPFVLGSRLLRGEVTILAAPGGRAKTALATAWACSLSSGRNLVGEQVHGSAKRVVYVSTEDNRAELQRRFRAAATAHNLTPSDLANVQIVGIDGVRFTLTGGTERAPTVNQHGLAALAELAREKEADALVLDPLGPLVPLGLNDNGLMGGLLLNLKQAAVAENFALLILHHFKKANDGSAESISGASAIVNHARAALTIESMDDASAKAFGVWPGEQYRWLRVVSLKANLAPPSDSEEWLHIASVELPNAEPPDYPYGDSVQAVVKPVGGPTATRLDPRVQATVEREFVKRVREALSAGDALRPSSRGGAGAPVAADVLRDVVVKTTGCKPNEAERIAGILLEDMKARGVVALGEVKGGDRKKRTRIVPGSNAPAEEEP